MNRWYVIRTKVGCETIAEERLTDQDFFVYLPRLIERRRKFGRRVNTVSPLFPQYLFLQLAVGIQDLAPAKSTKGVLGLVRFGEEYAVVPQRVIDGLIQHEDPLVQLRRIEDPLKPNSRVRVTGGAFNHFEGIFLTECADDRVTVLLNLLGRDTPVQLPGGLVELCA
jgi:transcriptional antiterminator RfaH